MRESKTEPSVQPPEAGGSSRSRLSRVAGPDYCYLAALLSGLLLGLSTPPYDFWPLSVVALVPLLASIRRLRRLRPALIAGWLAGTVFFLFNLHPLLSAHLWSGWATGDSAEFALRASRQFVVLSFLWLFLSLWGGMFWGIFAAITSYVSRDSLARMAVIAPAAFVSVAEWLRSVTSWDYAWGFLGNSLVELDGLRQMASAGGVWLLTIVAVLANIAVLGLVLGIRRPRRALASATPLVLLLALNAALTPSGESSGKEQGTKIRVAALQYSQDRYGFNDYMGVGLERAYLELVRQLATGRMGAIDLLVLPESIAYTIASLDGTRVDGIPQQVQTDLERWTGLIENVMAWSDDRMAVVAGLETAEHGHLHNSMVFWQPEEYPDWYHKQKLVPFAEYQPWPLRFFELSGSAFQRGTESKIVAVHGVPMGAFICQEVLMPGVARQSTLAGAQVLLSGGNDGVFADTAVARIHAKHARLRAVETGRFVVRAMKTGVSAIISPTGNIVDQSRASEPEAISGVVEAREALTPFVRWGNWPTALSLIVVLLSIVATSFPRIRGIGKHSGLSRRLSN